jgi:uncharacterized membrane protein
MHGLQTALIFTFPWVVVLMPNQQKAKEINNERRKIMSNLVVVGFEDEHTAFAMRAELAKLQKEYLIEMEDVVVVTKNEKGKVKLHQAVNLTAVGAVGGTFWGMLIGLIFLNPLLGAAVGAGAGAISGKLSDIGISDKFMKELAETFTPGSSALFVLVRKATPDKVLDQLKGFKGKILKTSLTADKEEALREVLEQD